MPSYSTNLRLIQPSVGEYPGTWGTEVNNRLTALVDKAVAGTANITMTAGNYTLNNANGVDDDGKAMFLVLGGTPGASYQVICPAISKLYFVTNNTGFAQVVITATGTGVSVPNGASMMLRCDGVNVVAAQNYFGQLSSAYTANGVMYLNGSNVVTTGSGLTFDGTSLGIGTSSPAYALHVSGSGSLARSVLIEGTSSSAVSPAQLLFRRTTTTGSGIHTTGSIQWLRTLTDSSTDVPATILVYGSNIAGSTNGIYKVDALTRHEWAINGSDFMVLNSSGLQLLSGNLGIGTTPSAWGAGVKAVQFSSGAFAGSGTSALSVGNAYFDGTNYRYLANGFAAYHAVNNGAGQHAFYVAPSGTAGNTISFTQAMTLDSSGNLGLGVTPGTWAAAAKAIEFTYPTYGQDSAGAAFMSFNARESSAGNWVYKTTDEANRFVANIDGGFRWYTAPSGTAGNAISFTQAMTLDASGNLAVGTSTTTNAKIFSFVNDATLPGLGVRQDGAGPIQIWQGSGGNERARITSGGDLLVGTTTSSAKITVEGSSLVARFSRTTAGGIAQFKNGDDAGYGIDLLNVAGTSAGSIYWTATTTTYATSSDARLKENILDADSASSLIDAIKVRKFDWKEDGSHQRYGFVAQELLPVAPEAVSIPADNPDGLMGVDYSKLVPMLIKEIQSLRARVAALEAQ